MKTASFFGWATHGQPVQGFAPERARDTAFILERPDVIAERHARRRAATQEPATSVTSCRPGQRQPGGGGGGGGGFGFGVFGRSRRGSIGDMVLTHCCRACACRSPKNAGQFCGGAHERKPWGLRRALGYGCPCPGLAALTGHLPRCNYLPNYALTRHRGFFANAWPIS
jgi:hypothetical protein